MEEKFNQYEMREESDLRELRNELRRQGRIGSCEMRVSSLILGLLDRIDSYEFKALSRAQPRGSSLSKQRQ